MLIYQNDKQRDINEIKKRLKTIYTQRSNIAHGNFRAYEKYKKNLKNENGEKLYIDVLVADLYIYIRAIIEEYLKDKNMVEFLKSG